MALLSNEVFAMSDGVSAESEVSGFYGWGFLGLELKNEPVRALGLLSGL